MDGVKLGISSRALGRLVPGSTGEHQVQGFHLICCDVVHDPSVNTPDGAQAFVNGIFESKDWILKQDGTIMEAVAYQNFEKSLSSLPKNGAAREEQIKTAVLDFLKMLGKSQKSS